MRTSTPFIPQTVHPIDDATYTYSESLLALPEIKREEILAERSEEKRRAQEKRLLAQMVKQQKGSGGMVVALDEDSVARAAKRT